MLRMFLEKTVVEHELAEVRCNACGRDVLRDKTGYLEDHVTIAKDWGYHSPYDGETHNIDLCVDCYTDWVAHFEIPPGEDE